MAVLVMRAVASQSSTVNQAFILGAGLGTRLRPLTDHLPKPLVPLFHKPLAEWAMEACMRAGIRRFAINTHHLPDAWEDFARQAAGAGVDLTFFHEPELLETGGGLKNIASWIGTEPLLVHNGDIFSSLPLEALIAAHKASGLPVTLALRSEGDAKHISIDPAGTRVTGIRDGRATHVFTGIYCVNAEFLGMLPEQEKISVIPAFQQLAREGRLGAAVLDEGVWLDLGDPESYLMAHRELALGPAIHPQAVVEDGAVIERSVIGPGAVIDAGAIVRESVVWPGCRVKSGEVLERMVRCS